MKNKILFISLAILIVLSMVTLVKAESFNFQQNTNSTLEIPLYDQNGGSLANCVANFTINYPNGSRLLNTSPATSCGLGSAILNLNSSQNSLIGNNYNGRVDFCSGTSCGFTTFTYQVSQSGQDITQQQTTFMGISIFVMLIVVAFFFVLGIMFKHPGTKIFLMSLSAITLLVLIGMVVSNATIYLSQFPALVNIYNSYYIAIMALGAAAMAGIILWLIYYGVQLFNKSRGKIPDDD